ncbi:beta strand repeat-containing protein [Prosthecobacter vanneervenii]|uniref:HYDIN/VesB/CFA65-like Ig-like domain-containing protein n=1 Tax=Prosthecobacter vanneervenii TaxID=48466 RepID=A0A7W7Y996_9BACT|nr:hypothetical protein [Prosthecobacter vanneervenii]MBB5031855.1 hypothetical protein [Prosthecobacter vanneervenii]
MRVLFVRVAASLMLMMSAVAAPLSGTRSIGPTGDYASIGAAVADIQAQTLGGALVLELQAGYVSNVETFPLVFTNLGTSAANTLTLRPQAGATALSISSADATAATIDLNGAQYVIIDGRPAGVGGNAGSGGGTASQLTIANTSTAGVALRFINEAAGNTVSYTTLRGVNTSATSGTVVFSTTTGANGNDNNTLDHCDLCDGASTPANGLYALGSTGTTAQNNSSNTVSNCNIFNFYAATAVDAAGVRLDAGNTAWTLSGSSFYQTASRAAVAANVRAIYVNSSSGSSFVVSGNSIGGSAPNAGGPAWTTTGTTVAYQFQGIWLSAGSVAPSSSVQGNTVQNFAWTSNYPSISHPGVWSGIYVMGGAVNVGTVTGNNIGSGTGAGSVSVTNSGSGGTVFGIASDSTAAISICNNAIGAITVNSTATTVGTSIVGIYTLQGTPAIRGNIIGSTSTSGSLNAATSSTYGQHITGILCSTNGAVIADNTVANLNNNDIGFGYIIGINTYDGANTVTGNVVRNFTTTSQSSNTTTLQSLCGILIDTATSAQTVSQNVVHSLANTASSAPVCVTGIYYDGNANSSVISRNLVHSLAVSSSSASAQVNGMSFYDGAFTAQNNMVRVGLDSSGAGTAAACIVRGIYDNGTTAGRNFFHNSVYVGGAQTAGTASTFAFDGIAGVTNARSYQNNIFVNTRSYSGGAGRNYVVRYGGTSASPQGLTAGGNILQAGSTGGVLGQFNGSDAVTLAAWQTVTGQDVSSAVVDPLFVNASGSATTLDLHLQASNPAESGGTPLMDALTKAPAAVTDDFDGQTRSTLTPADIGADAGNFTSSSGDIYAPVITVPLLLNGSTANRVLTSWATIADNSGSVAGSAGAPRLYFKKSTDADAFGTANDASGNGWKYVAATNTSSPYSFTMDYTLLTGGGAAVGDSIQYFIVAQDGANNLGSSPAAAAASGSPAVTSISAKPGAGVNSFSIVSVIGGTKTVGSGGDYASLSGTGGLFAAINTGVLTGNLVINITSDVVEDGTVSLNSWLEEGPGGYTLTLKPDSATMRTISGNINGSLITLNGADRVGIDGSISGTGRYLTFRNLSTGTSACTIRLANDASSNTVSNCVVEGATKSTTLGVIGFSAAATRGNNNNLITGCQVRDLSTTSGVPNRLIGVATSSVSSSGNTVSNSELFNFNLQGILLPASGSGKWSISGNNIYELTPAASSNVGISILGGGLHTISGNYIHDLLTTGAQSIGISCTGGGSAIIKGNRITALSLNSATTTVYGIFANSTTIAALQMQNNQITLYPSAPTSATLYGLYFNATSPGAMSLAISYNNSVVIGGVESGTRSSWAAACLGLYSGIFQNTLLMNFRSGTAGCLTLIPNLYTSLNNNVYAGTGATAANFMSFNNVPVSFAAWQSSTKDQNSQAGIAGTGGFTAAVFADAPNGDLHLVSGGSSLVNATGIPISGLADDYDGDRRNSATPSIGADEFPQPDIIVTQTTILTDGAGVTDFGNVTLGGSSSRTFVITNAGSADLTSLALSGGSGSFAVSALSGTTVSTGGSANFSVTFTPGSSGTSTSVIHLSSNVSGSRNPFDVNLQGTGLTAVDSWRQQYFGVTGNAGNAADAFDYDHDGLPNLVEWACNLNPTTSSKLPANTVLNGMNLEFTYTRSLSAVNAGTVFSVEWSDTLANDWQGAGVGETVLSNDGTVQVVKATLPIGSSGRRFVHLKVTAPP